MTVEEWIDEHFAGYKAAGYQLHGTEVMRYVAETAVHFTYFDLLDTALQLNKNPSLDEMEELVNWIGECLPNEVELFYREQKELS
jgi:hypothetical protein